MSIDTLFTLGWYLIGALFVVTEGGALYLDKKKPTGDKNQNGIHDDGFTLSEHLRKWYHVNTGHGRTAFLVTFGIFAMSFVLHINSGSWTG